MKKATLVIILCIAFAPTLDAFLLQRRPSKPPPFCKMVHLLTPQRVIGSCCLLPSPLRYKFRQGVMVPDLQPREPFDEEPQEPSCDMHYLKIKWIEVGICCTFVGGPFGRYPGPLFPIMSKRPRFKETASDTQGLAFPLEEGPPRGDIAGGITEVKDQYETTTEIVTQETTEVTTTQQPEAINSSPAPRLPEIGPRLFIDTYCKSGYVMDANYRCMEMFD